MRVRSAAAAADFLFCCAASGLLLRACSSNEFSTAADTSVYMRQTACTSSSRPFSAPFVDEVHGEGVLQSPGVTASHGQPRGWIRY